MSKVKVKVVIGSNYGDEGKGLATHFFSQSEKNKCLNVLFNGGCQRGHTVELKDGTRHIFHHFGSGTFDNAHTYFDQNFMVNPAIFIQEYNELKKYGIKPICMISPKCRVSTMYDMFINQIVEIHRDNKRHGSCGYGIWETQKRYDDGDFALDYNQLSHMDDKDVVDYLHNIANIYLPKKLSEYGITEIPQEYQELIRSEGLIEHFVSDLREMQYITCMCDFDRIRNKYNTIVFEGAQGLELDENNLKALPHITASNTTSYTPIQRVNDFDCDVEICYITRSYFTRHGAGILPTECNKSDINENITDLTNCYNDYQQTIRYGMFDYDEFINRVKADIQRAREKISGIKTSVMITHLNYTDNEIAGNCKIQDLLKHFDNIYLSNTRFSEDIKRTNKGSTIH